MSVKRVLVFRALMLGDLLCATPALRALRAALPGAQVTLVTLPSQRAFAERLPTVDQVVDFVGWTGLPELPEPPAPVMLDFVRSLRRMRFDLALQLHGSGGVVNALVAAFGARRTAGFAAPGVWVPPGDAASFAAWPEHGSEVERLLALTDHLGFARQGTQLDFPLNADDEAAAAPLLRALGDSPFALLHPGSQWPSRRWPPARFAAVGDALCAAGLTVVLTGTAREAPLTRAVAAAMHAPALDAAGLTSLGSLGVLVRRARVVVCNDTGLSHVAAALGTPSVVVASGSDVSRWAPADATRHPVLWADAPCRPCAHPECPLEGHPCASAIAADDVAQHALAQLRRMEPSHG
jgi:ADP-heptose:LPS heptosyltransferase